MENGPVLSDGTPPRKLTLSATQLDLLVEQVHSGVPHEVCGFLGGVGGDVQAVFPVPNVADEPDTTFYMEPPAQLKALLALLDRSWDIVAIYHSHPPGARPDPSPTDITNACYPGSLFVIIVPDVAGRIASLRAFSIDRDRVSEVPIAVLSGGL